MGRVLTLFLATLFVATTSAQPFSYSFQSVGGTFWIDCENTYAGVYDSENTLMHNESEFSIWLEPGNYTAYGGDFDSCQGVIPTTEDLPQLRPAPNQETNLIEPDICSQPGTSPVCVSNYITGELPDGDKDVFAVNVSAGDFVMLILSAASADLKIETHFQDATTETELGHLIDIAVNTSVDINQRIFIPVSDDGRLLFTVSSQSPDTLWATDLYVFDTTSKVILYNLNSIVSYGPATHYVSLNDAQSLTMLQSNDYDTSEEVSAFYRHVTGPDTYTNWTEIGLQDRILGLEGSDGIEIYWDCMCRTEAKIDLVNHYDAGFSGDAPGLMPMSATSDNSSYPLLNMDGNAVSGELTLFMGDYQDILRVETTGWNESIHLVAVTVEGDIEDLEITIWDIEQSTWEIHDSVTKTYSMNSIEASLEVGLGTHFIRIQHINGSEALGEDSESVSWTIRTSTAVIDEGEEPWFPPSDEVKEAADVFYWIIGGLLILPFLVFLISIKREQNFAQELASKKDRLAWLRKRLDKGEFVQSDISRALRAISTLEWEEAIAAWGEEDIRHHTEGVDLAIWRLDERVAKENGWPILIGIRPNEIDWEVAAIRFEAPEGQHWEVAKVQPRLLTRGNEIFLDTVSSGMRFFLQVELTGDASSLDVHLSGMVSGEPMAAKPSKTLTRLLEEE